MGRITSDLASFQQVHFDNLHKKNTGDVWLSKLINQLWLVMFTMWEHRNAANNSNETKRDKEEKKQLLLQVRREFSHGTKGLSPDDRHLLSDRFEILNYNLQELRTWTQRVDTSRKCLVRAQARLRETTARSRRLMESWCSYHR